MQLLLLQKQDDHLEFTQAQNTDGPKNEFFL